MKSRVALLPANKIINPFSLDDGLSCLITVAAVRTKKIVDVRNDSINIETSPLKQSCRRPAMDLLCPSSKRKILD
jgi:hypothetical protein